MPTYFDRITASPEILADALIMCGEHDITETYCDDARYYNKLCAASAAECRQCLIDWLNQPAE